jgi:hypothetical protein
MTDITITAEHKNQHPQINKPIKIRVNLEKLRNRLIRMQRITKSSRLLVVLYAPYCEYERSVRPITLSALKKCRDLIFIISPKQAGKHKLTIRIYLRHCMALLQEYSATLEVK